MKKISIFILFLIGINCKLLTLREDVEDIQSSKTLTSNSNDINEPDLMNNNQNTNEEFDEDKIMENFTQIDENPGNYYEIVIADMIIELIELNYESYINNNYSFDKNICDDTFIKLNETIKLITNFCESFKSIINKNVIQHKLLLSEDLLNSLPPNIEIQNDGPLGPGGEFDFKGDFGPKGKKGPLGPYGSRGKRKHHHHKHSEYGKFGRIYCEKNVECKEKKNHWQNWKNRGQHPHHRRLVEAVIDKHSICEYIYGFFGFDVTQCYE